MGRPSRISTRIRAKLRKDKTVSYYYAEFYDPERRPVQKRVSLGTADRAQAVRLFAQLEQEYVLGAYDPWSATQRRKRVVLLHDAVDEFVRSRKVYCSPSAVQTYEYVLGYFARSVPPDLHISAVENRHVDSFLNRPLTGGKQSATKKFRSETTNRTYRQRIRIFFEWCVEKEYVKRNPVPLESKSRRGKKTRTRRAPEFFTERQFESIVTAIKADEVLTGEKLDWLLNPVVFALNTGLRRGEICHLCWRAVDLETGVITVEVTHQFSPKSGRERVVPLSDDASQILERLAQARENEDEDETVFRRHDGNPLTGDYLSKRFKSYLRRLGMPERYNFHSLRHTFASWCAMRGVDIHILRDLLGHADIKQTQVYAHLQPETLRKGIEQAFGKSRSMVRGSHD